MSTQTYTNTDDFSAISNCSVESGSVVPGLFNFATDHEGTALTDFTQTPGGGSITQPSSGTVRLQSASSRLITTGATGNTMSGACYLKLNAATSGNFAYEAAATVQEASGVYVRACLLYRVDDTNYIGLMHYYYEPTDTYYTDTIKVVNGVRTPAQYTTAQTATPVLRLERSSNTFTFKVSSDGGSSFSTLGTESQAFGTGGNLCLANEYAGNQATLDFTSLECVSGLTADAEVLINDSGTFVADAGAGKSFDMSTATESTTGSPAVKYQYEGRDATVAGSDAATVDGNVSWNASWLTLAQLQSETDPTDQYLYLKAQLAGADGSGDTLDEFAVDTYTLDVTDPTAPNDPIGYYDDDAAGTYDIPIKLTEGSDTGSAGYAGFNVGLYISGEWRYEQSDGSFAADETFANLEIRGGNASTEYLGWVQSVADSPTQARFTSWDNAGNNSPRTDVVLQDIATQQSAAPTAANVTDSGNGVTWIATASGQAAGAALQWALLSDETTIVAITDASGETSEFTAEQALQVRALEAGKTASDWYDNGGAGIEVPALAATAAPSAPTLSMANDETGTSFTATVAGLESSDYRVLRYRNMESSSWVTAPDQASQQLGNGTIQVTGLSAGGYEVEAYGRNGDKYGPTSVRAFVWVDDGTASAHPVDAAQVAKWRSRLARTNAGPVTYHSRNGDSAAFDPTADTAVVETFDEYGGIDCTAPRGIPTDVVQGSDGIYAISDFYIHVMAEDLDAVAVRPKRGDRVTYEPTGEVYELVGWQLKFGRAVWMLALRKAD